MDEVEELPPGWYRQQTDPTHLRWWDGHAWTDDVLPADVLAEDQPRPRRRAPLRSEDHEPAGQPLGAQRRPTQPTHAGALAEETRRFAGTFGEDRAVRVAEERSSATRPPDDRSGGAGRPPVPRPRPRPDGTPPPRAPRPAGRTAPDPGPRRPGAPARRPPPRRPARGRAQYASRPANPHLGRFAFRLLAVAAVALLAYVLVRPFVTDPDGARTVADQPRSDTNADEGKGPLSDALLTLADFPAGWSAQADAGGERVGFCGGRNPLSVVVPAEELHASFSKTTAGPYVSEVALRYSSDEEAKQLMELVGNTLETCRTSDGNGGSVSLEPQDLVRFGDDTFAAHVTGQSTLGPIAGDISWVRKGNRIVSITTLAFNDLEAKIVTDVHFIELLTGASVDRLG